MRVVPGSRALGAPLRRGVVTVGNFDGLHVGHREILRIVTERARDRDGEAAVYTFEPHPRKVLRPHDPPKLLTTLEQKLELIEEAGVDVTIVEPFDRAFAGQSAVEATPVFPTSESTPTVARRRRDHQRKTPVSAMSIVPPTTIATRPHGEGRTKIARTTPRRKSTRAAYRRPLRRYSSAEGSAASRCARESASGLAAGSWSTSSR